MRDSTSAAGQSEPASSRVARLGARRRRRQRTRRVLSLGAAVLVVVIVAALAAFAFRPVHRGPSAEATPLPPTDPSSAPASSTTTQPRPVAVDPTTAQENAKPGTDRWRILPTAPSDIAGYADHVSVQRGDPLTLYVSSGSHAFHVEAYRMGWYQGHGARLVWRSSDLTSRPSFVPFAKDEHNTVRAPWAPSLQLRVPANWYPGDYLLKLVSPTGASYVPLTVRADASHAAVFIVNAVTTWQAYNRWGGYSLYAGPTGARSRATIVSFDRPYSPNGATEFIANELGLVALAERMGLDIAYTTDVDIHAHPELLTNHKVIVSLGHDEYWSKAMREGVEAARDKGVNVMFLGANALFRRIRLEDSPLGPYRTEVNFRTTAGDDEYHATKTEPTTEWRNPPDARPENSLTGTLYECNPVNVDGVVANQDSWMLAGTGLHNGDHLSLLVGTEYDRVVRTPSTPSNIEIVLHSPLRCSRRSSYSDAAYYTAPSAAGVFDAGTGAWVCKLFSGCPADDPFLPDPLIQKITQNILQVFAAGPAGRTHPSVPSELSSSSDR